MAMSRLSRLVNRWRSGQSGRRWIFGDLELRFLRVTRMKSCSNHRAFSGSSPDFTVDAGDGGVGGLVAAEVELDLRLVVVSVHEAPSGCGLQADEVCDPGVARPLRGSGVRPGGSCARPVAGRNRCSVGRLAIPTNLGLMPGSSASGIAGSHREWLLAYVVKVNRGCAVLSQCS